MGGGGGVEGSRYFEMSGRWYHSVKLRLKEGVSNSKPFISSRSMIVNFMPKIDADNGLDA